MNSKKLVVATLRTFVLGKLDLLIVYCGKRKFKSVTDISRGKLPGGNLSNGAGAYHENNIFSLHSYFTWIEGVN